MYIKQDGVALTPTTIYVCPVSGHPTRVMELTGERYEPTEKDIQGLVRHYFERSIPKCPCGEIVMRFSVLSRRFVIYACSNSRHPTRVAELADVMSFVHDHSVHEILKCPCGEIVTWFTALPRHFPTLWEAEEYIANKQKAASQ